MRVADLLMVVDGHSLMYRAYFALPPLETVNGVQTNAVFGFMNMLLRAMADHRPTHVCVAFDTPAPTFRHQEFDGYKATRKPAPDDLRAQFPVLKDLLSAMGIAHAELPGWEADDLLGTLAARAEAAGLPALLVTGDRDALQLISPTTRVLLTRKGISELQTIGRDELIAQFGYAPEQVPDLKALMGDASDNIPGVPKVGEKTALKLLADYQTLEGVLEHAQEQTPTLKKNLTEGAQQARASRSLATIDAAAPLPADLPALRVGRMATDEAFAMLKHYQMNSLAARLRALSGASAPDSAPAPAGAAWRTVSADSPEALAKELRGRSLPAALHIDDAGASVAFADGTLVRAPFGGDLLTPGLDPLEVVRALQARFGRGEGLCAHDAKTLRTRLAPYGADFPAIADDTLLAVYLLDAVSSPTLQKATGRLLGDERPDASGVYDLREKCLPELISQGMGPLYRDVEMPLACVLYDMEQAGFLIDLPELSRQGAALRQEAEAVRADIVERVGHEVNLNSPKQLAELLYDELQLPVVKKTATGRSTDADVLEQLAEREPMCAQILQYRQVTKLVSTYVDGLSSLVQRSGRIHTTFHQALTFTGRISSSEPNLQNIPIRTDVGRQIRRAFIAPEGCVLVDADYSQIELRVLAHMSGDPAFVQAFQSGQDIHARTAAEVFDVPLGEVTPKMRASAKAVNFGIVYGISDFGLARNIGCSRKEAAEIIERFFSRYPRVKSCMDGFVTCAKANGYVETLLHRRRRIPELSAPQYQTRMFGERAAMNTPIQGSAADIIKLAMVAVPAALSRAGLQARLILQVHDELIVEAPEREVQTAAQILKDEMERVMALSVPLRVDVGVGRNWLDAK